MPEATPDPVRKLIPISRIIEYPKIQPRVRLSESTIKDYTEILVNQGQMDEVTVFNCPEELKPKDSDGKMYFLLSSGHLRLSAYKELGKSVIPAFVREGSLSDALMDAITSNARHGLQLTNNDKHRACELAVNDPEMGKWKDAKIAKLLGVSTGLVNTVRRGIKSEDRKQREAAKPKEGKRETESPAPAPATARQRKDTEEDKKPTSKAVLRQIEEHVRLEVVSEEEVIRLFDSPEGCYHWTKKVDGKPVTLKIVNGQGRPLIEAPVTMKSCNEDVIVVSTPAKGLVRLDEQESAAGV